MAQPFTVVLDPGHGGAARADGSAPNNATAANGLQEKDLSLAVALAAARVLKAAQVNTILTREDDRNLLLAYLSNPQQAARLASRPYVEQVGLAVAQGLLGYMARTSSVRALDDQPAPATGEQVFFEAPGEHNDAPSLLKLPSGGKGQDRHEF